MSLIFTFWLLLFGLIPHNFQCAALGPPPTSISGSTGVASSNSTSSVSSSSSSSIQDSSSSTGSSVTPSSSITQTLSPNLSPSPTPSDGQASSEDAGPSSTPPDDGSADTTTTTIAAPDPSPTPPNASDASPTDKHSKPSPSTVNQASPQNSDSPSPLPVIQTQNESSTLPPSSVMTTASSASASQTPSIADSKSSSHAGPIAGGVVGGIILLLIIASIILRFRRGRERLDPYILDVPSHTVDYTPDSHSRLFAENPLSTDPFGAAPLQGSYGQSSLIPHLPMTAEEKMQLPYSGQLSIISTTTSAAGANELIPIHAMNSDQLDVVRILLKRSVPAETISRVIGRMMANQAGSNTMEGHDLIQMEPSMEPSLEYPATPRWL